MISILETIHSVLGILIRIIGIADMLIAFVAIGYYIYRMKKYGDDNEIESD